MDRKLLEQLEAELNAARKRREAACARFDEVMQGIPSGIPEPDGDLRRKRVGEEYRSAIRGVTDAILRLNRLMVFGEAPEGRGYDSSDEGNK
jgi:hypothetical protein